jgi:O-antigen ligase
MISQRLSRFYFISLDVLWAAALIGLPLTTFPLYSSLTGATVTPFSAGPILLLLGLWLLPALVLRRKRLPVEAWPLFLFVLVALLSAAAAFFIEIPTFKRATVLGAELRAFSTLVIGLAFYLVFAAFPQDSPRLRKSLQWIHLGGALMIVYTFSQVWYILSGSQSYPDWFLDFQNYLVIKPDYFFFRGNRTSGLTYEASWFGHQLTMLYFPLWLSATFQRKSSFNFRLLGISVENILLALGLVEFMMSGPRIALLSLLLMLVVLLVFFNVWLVRTITRRIASRRQKPSRRWQRIGLPLAVTLVLLAGYVLIAVGGIFFISQRDPRLQLLLEYPPSLQEISLLATLDEPTIIIVAARLAFLERVVYWLTGWQIFAEHPWLGVGLGNAGFFFLENIPAEGYMSQEIRDILGVLAPLPNIKSFWVRLLAETGLVGFYIFLGWYYLIGKAARLVRSRDNPDTQILSLAGLLALVAFIIEGFSIDSFAMPYLWVMTGLVSAAALTCRKPVSAP